MMPIHVPQNEPAKEPGRLSTLSDYFVDGAHVSAQRLSRIAMKGQSGSDLFADIDAKNFALVIVNPRISPRVQRAFVRDRVVVGGRRIEIVHLKFFSVYADDVPFRVTGLRLLVKNFNRALDDLILFLLVGI